MKVKLQDSKNNEVVIHLGDFPLPSISQNSLKIDCVTISPRYDHGFGFSQLYRVVKDKDSVEIKKSCDESSQTKQVLLLPKNVSDTWRVILTPTTKSNDEKSRQESEDLMLKLFFLTQSHEIQCNRLLITHFRHLQSYPDKTIDGLLDGLSEITKHTFLNLQDLYIEITDKFQDRLEKHFRSKFQEIQEY
ncbi:hypothetical protein DPM18_08145 [Polynucleobacter paneuropaeus]|jgi:hypothetical protein|uniref:hypothetical protein n=1 Tax=Polynucleobacter paneuropaeus TaxID=2527775 RepID=UPI000DBF31E0|nr:hypothetical protein [Polynucleobacter paneuropaeus]AWW46782.1 hypothetical protein DPM18_08145 [Polynucleobacter paneuropaeus]